MELIYTCISKLAIHISKSHPGLLEKNKSLLSYTDPGATYRVKVGKTCRGYVANVTESVGSAGSVVTDYQYEQSVCSGSQEEKSVLVTDGGYSSGDNIVLAAEKTFSLQPRS